MHSHCGGGGGGGVTGAPLFIAITGASAAGAGGGPNMASTFERNLSPSVRVSGKDVRKELDRRRVRERERG